MRLMNYVIVISAVFWGIVSCAFAAEGKNVHWIEIRDLKSVIEEHSPVIVDLRTPLEFKGGHLSGAINVPIENLFHNRALLDGYRKRSLLLYCRTVNKTGTAIALLRERGFKSIYALEGGYEKVRLHAVNNQRKGEKR